MDLDIRIPFLFSNLASPSKPVLREQYEHCLFVLIGSVQNVGGAGVFKRIVIEL